MTKLAALISLSVITDFNLDFYMNYSTPNQREIVPATHVVKDSSEIQEDVGRRVSSLC